MKSLAEALAKSGFVCLRFTCKGQLPARVAVFEAAAAELERRGVEGYVFTGRSMGSRAALEAATQRSKKNVLGNLKGVVLLAFPLQNPAVAGDRSQAVINAPDLPLLFISGTKDNMCNLTGLKGLFKQMTRQPELVALEGGDHGFNSKKKPYSTTDLHGQQNDAFIDFSQRVIEGKSGGVKRARDPGEGEEEPPSPKRLKQQKLATYASPEKKEPAAKRGKRAKKKADDDDDEGEDDG